MCKICSEVVYTTAEAARLHAKEQGHRRFSALRKDYDTLRYTHLVNIAFPMSNIQPIVSQVFRAAFPYSHIRPDHNNPRIHFQYLSQIR